MALKKKIKTGDHFPALVENLIIIMIIGVVIHTIIDDLAVINHWKQKTVIILALTGFAFDFFFTVEFAGRSIIAAKRGSFTNYIRYERGWIDALSSIPLLFLVSGPAVLVYFLGVSDSTLHLGFLSILKSAKAIRVTRILRLIRVIKLFGKIQNTDSVMTNRHIGMVTTIATVALVIVLVIVQTLPFTRIGNHSDYFQFKTADLSSLILGSAGGDSFVSYIKNSPNHSDIISIRSKSLNIIYENPAGAELKRTAYEKPIRIGEYEIRLSYHIADANHARANMMIFIAILGIIFSMMFLYSKIFAQQVADPIFVMDRGFRSWDYNLTVKENSEFYSDEVFKLATAYNKSWLPLKGFIIAKKRRKQSETEKSVLKMDDIL